MSKPIVLNVKEWCPSAIKALPPKTNKVGGKSINLISTQTNRSLYLSAPLMMTWGINDFTDDNGNSDGKYKIAFTFPDDGYKTPETDEYLEKLKDFQEYIIELAVKNSELWWGEPMSKEILRHTFFPFIKYSKNKDTKKTDLSRPPTIHYKVPNYEGKWSVELYNTALDRIFPNGDEHITPMDLVPKLSSAACVIQGGGIWIGGKGWGFTFKMAQAVVKPREVISVFGKCHIQLNDSELKKIETQEIDDDTDGGDDQYVKETVKTEVIDSDDEAEAPVAPVAAVAPVATEETVAAVAAEETVAAETTVATVAEPQVAKKKTIVRKKT